MRTTRIPKRETNSSVLLNTKEKRAVKNILNNPRTRTGLKVAKKSPKTFDVLNTYGIYSVYPKEFLIRGKFKAPNEEFQKGNANSR